MGPSASPRRRPKDSPGSSCFREPTTRPRVQLPSTCSPRRASASPEGGLRRAVRGRPFHGLRGAHPSWWRPVPFQACGNGKHVATTDPRLADGVVDNLEPLELTETESLVIGRTSGSSRTSKTAPSGNLYVVSLSNGAVYEVFPAHKRRRSSHRHESRRADRPDRSSLRNRSTGARVSFELATAGATERRRVRPAGRVVRRIAQDQNSPEGPNTLVWDGRTDGAVWHSAGSTSCGCKRARRWRPRACSGCRRHTQHIRRKDCGPAIVHRGPAFAASDRFGYEVRITTCLTLRNSVGFRMCSSI
jgi:hypothetical protein